MNRLRRLIDKIREQMRAMLSLDAPPRKIAMAAALGILIGISPYTGFQTYLAIGCASLFRLPAYPILLGTFLTNPLTIPFIYTATTKFGMWLLNIQLDYDLDFSTLSMGELANMGKVLLLPFFVGTHVVGAVLSVFTYFIVYYIVKRYRRHKTPE